MMTLKKQPKLAILISACLILLQLTPVAFALQTEPRADLVLLNGRIWTGDGRDSFAEALAISGRQILEVGQNSQIRRLIGPQTRVVHLNRRLVLPGFNDSHIHFLSGSLGLTRVDLTGATSVAEMLARIKAFASQNPSLPWITGRGWEYTYFPGGMPTKSFIDGIVSDRPVFLSAYDGHSGWANSKALELAGIDRNTPFTGFGEIVRNEAGEPTGALKEGAQRLVSSLIPQPTRAEKLEALRKGLALAASLGITSIQNASGSPDELSLYEELHQLGQLSLRLAMAFSANEKTSDAEIARMVELQRRYQDHRQLRASAVKFVLDGVIESHTAAMIERYSDLPPTSTKPFGELAQTADGFRAMVARLDKLGFQILTHAIGDRAVRETLQAYELTQTGGPAGARPATRHRIEHIETLSPADVGRFLRLGVIASMQPIHADPGTVEVWSRAVGPERLPMAFPWATLRQSGATLAFCSDWPACISL
ncbi:MAG: amidohydrolase, partial [Acidobacteriota bacterium]